MADVHVSRIEPHPANIREDLGDMAELTDSVRVHGILQPLIVQPVPGKPGSYRLLAGHRRLAAAKRARLDTVPVVIKAPQRPAHALEIMLIENCQRRDLGPVEKAEAMDALIGHGLTAAQIARRTGLSASTVSYHLALLELDQASRERIRDGQVKVGDAISAVRKVRRRERGGTTGRRVQAEPAWLTSRHPLARPARALCDSSGHGARPQVGNVACGQCWEQSIRDDQRRAKAERCGVTTRTIERYKADLATAGAQ
jgi:ParB family chromosome partitioning protein